jgi:hypothetical protein
MGGLAEILGPVQIPGWGQISYGYLEDAVTRGNHALQSGGAAYALKYHEAELQRLVDMKIWRSPAAYDLLTKLRRMVLAEQTEPVDELRICEEHASLLLDV